MFRRVYWQIAALLMTSTVVLLLLIGGGVYLQLRFQLQHDELISLQEELPEIKLLVKGDHLTDPDGVVQHYPLVDDKGQHVYFLVTKQNQLISVSNHLPTTEATLLKDLAGSPSQCLLSYHGTPYFAYSTVWKYHNVYFDIHLVESIWTQQDMLNDALQIMLIMGGIGILVALFINLRLGRRVLRPAVEMYNAQQHLMTEVSHELQTPLATLNVLSAQIEDTSLRNQLQREVLHASDLVHDILYLSKLRSLPPEEKGPVAVSDITEEVAERLSILAKRRGIVLSGWAEQGLFVEATREYWERMVSTVLKNVVDHAVSPSEAHWKLQRIDNNVELVVENQVLDDSTKSLIRDTKFEGFGISIMYRLAKAMNGNLNIRQTGVTFIVEVKVPALLAPME